MCHGHGMSPHPPCALQSKYLKELFELGHQAWRKATDHKSPVPDFLARCEKIIDDLIAQGKPDAGDQSMGAELMKHYLAGRLDKKRLVAETAMMMLAGEANLAAALVGACGTCCW
jgi:cytochrome P450